MVIIFLPDSKGSGVKPVPVHPPLRATQVSNLIDTAINRMALSIGLTLDQAQSNRFAMAYQSHLKNRLNTPRAIKRYVSQVEAGYPGLATEVDPVDFLLLTWLRSLEPALHSRLYAQKADLTGGADPVSVILARRNAPNDRTKYWEDALQQARIRESDIAAVHGVLSEVFPRFSDILKSRSSFQGTDPRPLRAAHPDYFDRYFAASVPSEDLPDSEVKAAMEAIVDDPVAEEVARLETALRIQTPLALSKFEAFAADESDTSALSALLKWLAVRVESIPETNDLISPRRSAAGACSRLYVRLQPTKEALCEVLDAIFDGAPGGPTLAAQMVHSAERFAFSGDPRDVEARSIAYPLARLHFAARAQQEFEDSAAESVFDLSFDMWRVLFAWREIDPPAVKKFLDDQIGAGRWSRLDLAARIANAEAPVGVPNPTWRLRGLSMPDVEELVGVAALIAEVGEGRIRALSPEALVGQEATPANRRALVLQELRSHLDSGRSAIDPSQVTP